LVMIETPKSEFSDYMVKESLSQEEREKDVDLEIIGNFKNWAKKPESGTTDHVQDNTDLPF